MGGAKKIIRCTIYGTADYFLSKQPGKEKTGIYQLCVQKRLYIEILKGEKE